MHYQKQRIRLKVVHLSKQVLILLENRVLRSEIISSLILQSWFTLVMYPTNPTWLPTCP